MKIEEIDRNFRTATLDNKEVVYFDALKQPFALEGFPWYGQHRKLNRLPAYLTKEDVNEGALYLAQHTAGGAIRFRTNSRRIALKATLENSSDMNHMPRAGSAGFDLFKGSGTNRIHAGTAQPSRDQILLETMLVPENPDGMQEWLLNLPLYGGTSSVEVGLEPGAELEAPASHAVPKPVLFYGSSITQGGCASRPGNAYTSMLCRLVDAEQINLGFSGSGKGEIAVAEAIASLNLSAFVMDYDHNAPSVEHLRKTHEPFFRAIRAAHPELPVIFLSKCDIWEGPGYREADERRRIVRTTYENALAAGDSRVRFIDGETLFGKDSPYRSWCTVDRCHPNDLGFFLMFQTVLPVLKEVLSAPGCAPGTI